MKALKALYTEHVTIARFGFRNDPYMQEHLQLKGIRKKDWNGWTAQVNKFYVRVEQEGLPVMKKHGVKAEELAQGKAMAEAVVATYDQQKSNVGDAQSDTFQKTSEVLPPQRQLLVNRKAEVEKFTCQSMFCIDGLSALRLWRQGIVIFFIK